jgi:hypothetical protein
MSVGVWEQAARHPRVAWVGLDGATPRAVWHVWHDGGLHVVTGPGEQELPGAADAERAVVSLRDRAPLSGTVLQAEAVVQRVHPGTTTWEQVVPLLVARRLNAPDLEGLAERWAADAVVLRLTPASL